MGSAALKPEAAVGQMMREKRKDLGLTLQQVSELLDEQGDRIPTSTLARIERGELDPGVRRLHLLLRLYRVPPHFVADLIEMDAFVASPPAGLGMEELLREGLEHWQHGDIARGLAWFSALRARTADDPDQRVLRQRATLSFANAARNLGKFRLALQMIQDLLCEPHDPSLTVQVLVLGASVWRGLGSHEMALALVRQAGTHVDSTNLRGQSLVLHQSAKLLLEGGQIDEAEALLDRALGIYREMGDAYGEVRALVLRVQVLERRGRLDEAFACAHEVLERAGRHEYARLVITGRLELGRLQLRTGSVDAGLETLREALGQAVLLGDKSAEFLAHYYLWKGYESLGDRDRSRIEKETASYFVRFVDDHSAEADEVRQLLGGRDHA